MRIGPLGPLQSRVVGVALGVAALGGLALGALLGAAGDGDGKRPGSQAADGRPAIPVFAPRPPTATPKPDHPSPDLGRLVGVRKKDGKDVLRFDRVTVQRSPQGEYTVDNRGQKVRERRLADGVKVLGADKLVQQPQPTEVPLPTLLRYLEGPAAKDPLLVWLSYDGAGGVVEIREQALP